MEVSQRTGRSILKAGRSREAWLHRLEEADLEGKLRGYYEPEEQGERGVARKRFLAPSSRLSSQELERLMGEALGFPPDLVRQAADILSRSQRNVLTPQGCN